VIIGERYYAPPTLLGGTEQRDRIGISVGDVDTADLMARTQPHD